MLTSFTYKHAERPVWSASAGFFGVHADCKLRRIKYILKFPGGETQVCFIAIISKVICQSHLKENTIIRTCF